MILLPTTAQVTFRELDLFRGFIAVHCLLSSYHSWPLWRTHTHTHTHSRDAFDRITLILFDSPIITGKVIRINGLAFMWKWTQSKIGWQPREGVIIEWPLKRLFNDARDVILTSRNDVRGFAGDDNGDKMLILTLKRH